MDREQVVRVGQRQEKRESQLGGQSVRGWEGRWVCADWSEAEGRQRLEGEDGEDGDGEGGGRVVSWWMSQVGEWRGGVRGEGEKGRAEW